MILAAVVSAPYLLAEMWAIKTGGDAALKAAIAAPSMWWGPVIAASGDIGIALFLARFVLQLPRCAVELSGAHSPQGRGTPRPDASWRSTLLLATLPLTVFCTLPAIVFPDLTATTGSGPDGTLPAWVMAVTAIDTLLQDLLYFYASLVFLSTLSLWYRCHERLRVPAGINAD